MYNYSYETLSNFLVSDWQIRDNLDRSMNKNLISKLSKNELTALALKYYAVDKNGKFTSVPNKMVGYVCPYTGEIVEINKIQLDHIIPLQYNGGTVIFNCIPVSEVANRSKWHSPDLIEWWKNQPYFDLEKLERLVNYMLDAYKIYVADLESNSIDYSFDVLEDVESEELFEFENEDVIPNEGTVYGKAISYHQLMEKMIKTLPKERQKVYLNQLSGFDIFSGIEKIEEITKILKDILSRKDSIYLSAFLNINLDKLYKSLTTDNYEKEIKDRFNNIERILKDNNKTLKTYFDSLKDIEEYNLLYFISPNQDQIDKFVASLKLDLDTKINLFIEMASKKENNRTKYSHNILVPTDDNIFNTRFGKKYIGYEDLEITTKGFYSFNKLKIKNKLKEEINQLISKRYFKEEDKERLKVLKAAELAISHYEFYNPSNASKRIDIFLEMISKSKYTGIILNNDNNRVVPDDNSAFSTIKGVKFEGYEEFPITTKAFYNTNRENINSRLNFRIRKLILIDNKTEKDIKELKMLEKAKKAIDDYEFYNTANVDKRIDKFIEMLSNPRNTGIMLDDRGRVVPNDNSILNNNCCKPFKDYEHLSVLNVSYFYENNKDLIKSRIESKIKNLDEFENLEDLNKFLLAKKAIDDYEFYNPNDNSKRVEKFIEMLGDPRNTGIMKTKKGVVPDNNSIFQDKCTKLFKDYEHLDILNVGHFYDDNEDFIKYRIDRQINELRNKIKTSDEILKLDMLKRAKRAVDDFDFYRSRAKLKRIDKFIEMLSDSKNTSIKQGASGVVPADDSIFNYEATIPFKDYEHLSILTTKNFYGNNKDDIRSRIKEQLLELSKLKELKSSDIKRLKTLRSAQQAIDDFDFYNPNDNTKRIEIFIEMIGMDKYTGYINGKPAKGNIFKEPNRKNGQIDKEDLVPFYGYEHIEGLYIKDFFRKYSDKKIIPLLFFDEKYSSPKYDKARENILTFLNYKQRLHKKEEFKSIYDYLSGSNQSEKKKIR